MAEAFTKRNNSAAAARFQHRHQASIWSQPLVAAGLAVMVGVLAALAVGLVAFASLC